jgi:hypothetical protein
MHSTGANVTWKLLKTWHWDGRVSLTTMWVNNNNGIPGTNVSWYCLLWFNNWYSKAENFFFCFYTSPTHPLRNKVVGRGILESGCSSVCRRNGFFALECYLTTLSHDITHGLPMQCWLQSAGLQESLWLIECIDCAGFFPHIAL